ncbi:hypothetical protein ASG40_11680 [Methylobacterium sp. Leaf399]|nr:hypothetical protein ASG40_11680 [Methylobacterium sp. Leaf399]
MGGSLLLSALTTPDTKAKVASQQFSSRQPLPPRRKAYGTVMLAGPKVEYRSSGGRFYNAIYHCEGPIASFEGYWLEDVRTALVPGSLGGPSGIFPYLSAVVLEGHLGAPSQAASTLLQELGYWTADDRLSGAAYSVMRATAPAEKQFTKVFPSGTWPEHRVLIRASRVRNVNDVAQTQDPATWGWSDLASLCIRDHLTDPKWGMKVPADLIDDASFSAAAILDFQTITKASGALRPRYYIGGAFDLTDEPADALQGMLDARDGRLFLTPEGKVGISGGVYVAPEVTLTDPQILSLTIEVGSRKRATFNRLKVSFVSPAHDYQVVEGDPWEDLDAQEEAGEILEADFARPWVQDHNQLRRLAKIHTAKSNPDYRITGMVTDRSGLPALFEDTIRLVLTRYGIDAIFTVERAVASGDGSTCTYDLTSLDPACYNFDAATEEGIEPALPNTDALATAPAPPVDLAAEIERRTVSGETNATFLVLTSDEPSRADLALIGRYRAVGATDWVDMVSDGESRGRVVSSVLTDGQAYEAQGAIASYGRAAQSAWTATDPATITAIADTTSTGAPTAFVVNGGAGQASYAFTAPNAANFGSAKIFRGTTTTFADATAIRTVNGSASQSFDGTDSGRPPGTYRYWVRAYNRSGFGDATSTAGPITVTVT